MAKFNLVRTYNNTIPDVIKIFGRKNTNRLFPQVYSSPVNDLGDETIEDTPVNAIA
jgi:hypothetical protein